MLRMIEALGPCGEKVLIGALRCLEKGDGTHFGFSLACKGLNAALAPRVASPFCDKCKQWRVLRTYCLWCGKEHDVATHLANYIKVSHALAL